MIIVKTDLKKKNLQQKNSYICSKCDHTFLFNAYIPVACPKCKNKILNIEKLLTQYTNNNILYYYVNEKI